MPSIEGDEIDVVLSKGFRESNITIVDRNPAIVATLKRRYPRINTIGLPPARVSERIPCASINVASFDLCGNVCNIKEEIFAASSILADFATVSVTMLRGRETGFQHLVDATSAGLRAGGPRDYHKGLTEQDRTRSSVVENALCGISREVFEYWQVTGKRPEKDKGNFPIRLFTYRSSSNKSTLLVGFYQMLIKSRGAAPSPELLKAVQTIRRLRKLYFQEEPATL